MLPQLAGYLSGVLIFASYIPYLRNIFKHTTKPQRASWLIWSILGAIAFFSQWAKGAADSLILTGVQEAGDLLIFLLAIKFGMGGWNKEDKIALLGAAISLVLWYVTKEPAVALFIIIFVDAIGGVLTMLKGYKNPETETALTFGLTAASGFFASLAVGAWNFTLLAFPVYVFLISTGITLSILFGRSRNIQK